MKEKNQHIEMIRAIACFMVITIHVVNYFCRAYGEISDGEYLFAVVGNALVRVGVPCFFMISGALLLHRQDTIKQSLKRTWRILLTLIVWSIIYYFFNVYYRHTPVNLREVLRVPAEAHLWYLYTLILIYLALPLLQWICGKLKDWQKWAILYAYLGYTVISTIIVAYEKIQGHSVNATPRIYCLFYLLAGHVFMQQKDKIKGQSKVWFLIYLISCVLNAGITYFFSVELGRYEGSFFWYRSVLIVVASFSFFIYMIKRESVRDGQRLAGFCECSFGIYLVHILFLDIFKQYVKAADVNVYWVIPVLTVGIALASWGVVWLLRRCKWGRKIS